MKNWPYLLEESVLGQATLMLLSSSTVNRYIRLAKRLAESSDLKRKLELGLITSDELLEHADNLWRFVVESKERDLPEIELALILPIVSRFATEKAIEMLLRISVYDKTPAIWISTLARDLYNRLSANQTVNISTESSLKLRLQKLEAGYVSFECKNDINISARDLYSNESLRAAA